MADSTTKDRILDTGEQLFAEKGYAGTSVRSLAAAAEVDLGAIGYHFGSKAGLFAAILRRRFLPITAQRLAALEEIEWERPNDEALREILKAFMLPAVRLITHPAYGEAWQRLILWSRIEPAAFQEADETNAEEVFPQYLKAFTRQLPHLSKREIAHRFHQFFCTEVGMITEDRTIKILEPNAPSLGDDPEGVLDKFLDYIVAGLRATSSQSAESSR